MVDDLIKDMDNVELFDYLHSIPGHRSDYSSLYLYLAKHPPMHDYYRNLFKVFGLGTSFLDLGPGVGESLDVARELGAYTAFVDRDIYISQYCKNKGHHHYDLDYFSFPLKFIQPFDLVLSRGSLNVDMMNETDFPIHRFLNWLTNTGRRIVVIPTWNKGDVIDGHDYTCVGEHYDQYMNSDVHRAFIDFGFIFNFIEGINDKYRFPITYVNFITNGNKANNSDR